MRLKLGDETRTSGPLEAQHGRCFSAVSPGEGKEILSQSCQWIVFGLSTNCKIGIGKHKLL